MTIEFGVIGSCLGTRFYGAKIRDEIITAWQTTETFTLDFTGVDEINETFADECFVKLLLAFDSPGEAVSKLIFKNASPFIKGAISKAIRENLATKAQEIQWPWQRLES